MRSKMSYYGGKDDKKIVVGIGSFGIFVSIAILSGVFIIIMLQAEQGSFYNTAIQQFMLLLGGLFLTFMAYAHKDIIVRTENAKDYAKWIVGGTIAFVLIRGLGMIIQLTGQMFFGLSSIGNIESFNIVATAAVYEEILFSLGLGTVLMVTVGKAFYEILNRKIKNDNVAWFVANINVGILLSVAFALLHIFVYNTDPILLSYLFMVRMVLYMSYAITRNIMTPIWAHWLNNVSLVVLMTILGG